jgi:S1-C subfamily serine protease
VSDVDDGPSGRPDDERSNLPPWWVGPDTGASQPAAAPPVGAWPPPPPPPPATHSTGGRPRRRFLAIAAVVAALALLAGGIGIGRFHVGTATDQSFDQGGHIQTVPPGSAGQSNASDLSADAIARKLESAIVDINTLINAVGDRPPAGQAAGTGMVVTSSGEVVTNNHVIAGATSIRVSIPGHSGTYSAHVVGADPPDDIALLQVDGVSGLPTVTLADSSGLTVGQRVVAIGNALGRGGPPTVTEGVIVALHRSITAQNGIGVPERLRDLIQSNAPISPGDSGGALVNSAGQVVGMITAASTGGRTETTSNEGYAISTNAAVSVLNSIRDGEESSKIVLGQPGFLGIEVGELDGSTAEQLGVRAGVLVEGVIPGTPAARVGIPQGAVITGINGRTVRSRADLGPAIYTHSPGEQIQVTWVDGSGTHTSTVTLMAGPAV